MICDLLRMICDLLRMICDHLLRMICDLLFLSRDLDLSRLPLSRSLSRSLTLSLLRDLSLLESSRPECLTLTSLPPFLVPPRPPPSLRGSHPLTVRPLSTSTKTLRPSIFLPSAFL